MTGLRSFRVSGRSWLFWLFLGMSLFACQLPGALLRSIRPTDEAKTPTPTVSPTTSRKKPIPITPTPTQATVYPGLPATDEYPQPYLQPGTALSTESSDYPSAISPTSATPNQTALVETPTGYPAPIQAGVNTPYPGEMPTMPSDNPYPGLDIPQPPGAYPYPQMTVSAPTNYPPPGSGESATAIVVPDLTRMPPEGTPSATVPRAVEVTKEPPAIPLSTQVIATPSLTPTRTPFLTPTPTLTLTPTPTRTALPAPAWVSAKLEATDPDSVELAAGKPQLIEFFAFWSGPSQAMAPLIHGIEEEFSIEVNFIYLDIDDPAVGVFKRELGFRVEPHFFLLDGNGKVLQQWVGYVSIDTLRNALENALN